MTSRSPSVFSGFSRVVAACATLLGACSSGGSHSAIGQAGSTGMTGTAGNMGTSAAGTSGGGGAGSTGNAGAAGSTDTGGSGGSALAGSTGTAGTAGASGGSTGNVDAGASDGAAGSTLTDGGGDGALANWVLTWSDEFNAAAGTLPDPKYWSYDLGGGGWGVAQLQVYTNKGANAATDGKGNLAIIAVKDAAGNFTSARLKTQAKFEQAYGRFEIRVKVATGNGMWPAFWMLGNNFGPTPWPDCGEIDVMEIRGTNPYVNLGSLHGPGYSGMHPLTGRYTVPDGGAPVSDDFHVYAIEWETNVVRFYFDDVLYETQTSADVPTDGGVTAKWVYDHPFFLLMNLAVGGRFPGPPDGTVFPQTMLVDYVRAYSRPQN